MPRSLLALRVLSCMQSGSVCSERRLLQCKCNIMLNWQLLHEGYGANIAFGFLCLFNCCLRKYTRSIFTSCSATAVRCLQATTHIRRSVTILQDRIHVIARQQWIIMQTDDYAVFELMDRPQTDGASVRSCKVMPITFKHVVMWRIAVLWTILKTHELCWCLSVCPEFSAFFIFAIRFCKYTTINSSFLSQNMLYRQTEMNFSCEPIAGQILKSRLHVIGDISVDPNMLPSSAYHHWAAMCMGELTYQGRLWECLLLLLFCKPYPGKLLLVLQTLLYAFQECTAVGLVTW